MLGFFVYQSGGFLREEADDGSMSITLEFRLPRVLDVFTIELSS